MKNASEHINNYNKPDTTRVMETLKRISDWFDLRFESAIKLGIIKIRLHLITLDEIFYFNLNLDETLLCNRLLQDELCKKGYEITANLTDEFIDISIKRNC